MNREQMLGGLLNEDARVQYDGQDDGRIAATAESFTEAALMTIEALGRYRDAIGAEVDENSADVMKGARFDVVFAWATAQAAISKIAHVLRIDGDEAFSRALTAAKTEDEPQLQGL